MIRVHQVLATLGYGDAIGHEVLGIQRVLRSAGYRSEIFVEAADRRLESMTRDYRHLIEISDRDNLLLHHFSLASKASRTAFALPDRMALIYHNITPPEFLVGPHRSLDRERMFPRTARASGAYAERACDLALGDLEFNREELEALGFPDAQRRATRGRRISPISTEPLTARSPICSTTPGPTSCLSAAWCRTRSSKI